MACGSLSIIIATLGPCSERRGGIESWDVEAGLDVGVGVAYGSVPIPERYPDAHYIAWSGPGICVLGGLGRFTANLVGEDHDGDPETATIEFSLEWRGRWIVGSFSFRVTDEIP